MIAEAGVGVGSEKTTSKTVGLFTYSFCASQYLLHVNAYFDLQVRKYVISDNKKVVSFEPDVTNDQYLLKFSDDKIQGLFNWILIC